MANGQNKYGNSLIEPNGKEEDGGEEGGREEEKEGKIGKRQGTRV